MPTPVKITIDQPRYIVEKAANGHSIIDTTGEDAPYTIEIPDHAETDTPEGLQRWQTHTRETCEGWAYIWNVVELGYCGGCQHKFIDGETKHAAVGFHSLDKVHCFNCACSAED